jgi:SagB-type dehydrogenase family enzyme
MARASLKLQIASCQTAYWQDGKLWITNYLTRGTFSAKLVTLEILRFFIVPRTFQEALLEFRAYSPASVAKSILKLIGAQLLLEAGSAESQRDELVRSSWGPWLPEGGFFHFMTKDTPYVPPNWTVEQRLATLQPGRAPPQFKRIRSSQAIRLPKHTLPGDSYFETIHARRTHRTFARGKLPLENISRLLQTTWGVQGYFQTEVFGKLPYKTSPSGGSRHPGEVYLMALKVDGLESGLYHYHSRDGRLTRLPGLVSPRKATQYCANQAYVAKASALFIMTAVFARSMWKYGKARAYRVVLLETGHLCQTFCLTATRLGLAPFSTAALKDSLIEKDLGLDGIRESVLYVAGVGLPNCPLATAAARAPAPSAPPPPRERV